MNTDKINEIIDKIPINLLMLIYLLYLGLDYYNFTSESASPLVQKQQEISAAKNQMEKSDKKIKELNLFVKTLDLKKSEIRRMTQELDDVKASLPEVIDIPRIMKMMITEAKKAGISVTSLRPTSPKDSEFYTEQPFTLTFRGIYPQLMTLLDRLSNITDIIRVDHFNIKAGDPSRKYVELEGSLEIKIYKYLSNRADGVASIQPQNQNQSQQNEKRL